MTPEEFSRRIYCAIMDATAFDPANGLLSLTGTLTERGTQKRVVITATNVVEFSWNGRPKEPEGLFELSTVEIRDKEHGWEVEFEPWYSTSLRFVCGALELNGERVEGSGSWYQDSLNGPVATAQGR